MQYTNFGNTGMIASRLSLGAMTFGQGPLVGDLVNNIDQTQADQMVAAALDAGINCFDTADMYTNGQSETMLGKALKARRHDAIIATKCGFRSGEAVTACGLSYRYVLNAVEASLKRLDTDYIDLFQLHIPDPVTPLEETLRALETVIQKGWVRYGGYCNYPAWKAQKMLDLQAQNHYARFISAQMYYSLLGRDIENEVVPFLTDSSLALMAWSPLASGFLSGKYTRDNPVSQEGRRAKFDFPPVDVELGYKVVEHLQSMTATYNASVAQLAISWLLSKPYVSTVIVGANTIGQLIDNLGAVNVQLQEPDLAELDELTANPPQYPGWMQPMGWDETVKTALGGTAEPVNA